MDSEELTVYYRLESWNSPHVTLLGNRENFRGPKPRSTVPIPEGRLPSSGAVFDLYWPPATLEKIVEETNCYAREELYNKYPTPGEKSVIKGRRN